MRYRQQELPLPGLGMGQRGGESVDRRANLGHLGRTLRGDNDIPATLRQRMGGTSCTPQWPRDPLREQYPQPDGEHNSDEQRDQHPPDERVTECGGVGPALQQHDASHPGGTSLDEHPLAEPGSLL